MVRARTEGLRQFGACLAPMNAFYLLQGIETLESAHAAAHRKYRARYSSFCEQHDGRRLGAAPESAGSSGSCAGAQPAAARLRLHDQFRHRGRPRGRGQVHQALRLASHLANVGDAKTLVIHPASTTHQQMSAAQLRRPVSARIWCVCRSGIESVEDIISDLDQALRAALKT